jgi:hypothetical protein
MLISGFLLGVRIVAARLRAPLPEVFVIPPEQINAKQQTIEEGRQSRSTRVNWRPFVASGESNHARPQSRPVEIEMGP